MKKMLIPFAILLLAACASKSPQQMSPRELAKCAWNGNAACQTELQHRFQVKRGATSAPASSTGTP